jgi:small subunit ribosomal protein S1
MDQPENQVAPEVKPENSNNESTDMASLLENENIGIDSPTKGEIRPGVVTSVRAQEILVSVGTKSEGVITGREFEIIPEDERQQLKAGQEILVFVIDPEDDKGNLVLSYMRAREEHSWQEAEALLESKAGYHSEIVGYNKGGLIVPIGGKGGLRGFVPASQISLSRRANLQGETPEQKWSKMIGMEIDVCVIEVDRERRRLILSERAASTETREQIKERILDELKDGEVRIGRITSLADFGAFVNIGGADGLVHLSEISWERINHPSEVLKVGQEVKVKVIAVDREKKRIGLSIRQMQEDPWGKMVARYQVGQLVQGEITRLTKFGAFARIEGDVEGLIHISEISEKRIEHPKEVLKEGETITLRIIRIDPDNHRIGLSVRRVDSMAYADMDWQTLLETGAVEEEHKVEEVEAVETVEEAVKLEEPVKKPARAAGKTAKPAKKEKAPAEPVKAEEIVQPQEPVETEPEALAEVVKKPAKAARKTAKPAKKEKAPAETVKAEEPVETEPEAPKPSED